MSGDQPFARHEGVIVLLLLLAGFLATVWLAVYGIRMLLRTRTKTSRAMALVSASALAWAATVGLYVWGLLHLFIADDYTVGRACGAAVGKQLTGYDPSFIPLQFGCVSSDGRSVPVVIPSYVNPVLAALLVCAVTLTVCAIVRSKEKPRDGEHPAARPAASGHRHRRRCRGRITVARTPAHAEAPTHGPDPDTVRKLTQEAQEREARVRTGAASSNGWEMEKATDDRGNIYTRPVPGTPLGVQVRMGDVETVLVHVISRFHYEIDALG